MKKILLMAAGIFVLVSCATPCFSQAPEGGPGAWPTDGRPPEPPKLDVGSYENKALDLSYANKSESQKLDIYLPDDGAGPFPVIVYIHGGGWEVSDKRSTEIETVLKEALARGYAVVSINHRPASEALFPAQIQDVKTAIRWVRASGGKYRLATQRIGAWGSSSGGHLAALLGTTGSVKQFDDAALGNSGVSSAVQAVVCVSGPINFITMDEQLKQAGFTDFASHGDASGPESSLLGAPINTVADRVSAASPGTYIGKDAAPILLEYGAKDNSVPVAQATEFAERLKPVIGEENVTVVVFPEGGHGGGDAFNTPENMDTIFSFLDRHLK